jgi:hypothetical protein
MTVKVTFTVNGLGDTMVDNFDMTLTEFINNYPDFGIDLESIIKIEVI